MFARFYFTAFALIAAARVHAADYETITFPSGDSLEITADLYTGDLPADAPMIVLCHQAGWSRGEYRQIAPRLVELGFRCLAIDQRSGQATEGVTNETARRAQEAGKPTGYADAEQDLLAALEHARGEYTPTKTLLWGSSYSSSLALRIAGTRPELVDGVLAFAPGEYFGSAGKPGDWIAQGAAGIRAPAFVTSAKHEEPGWRAIFDAIPGDTKTAFVPTTRGNHGSRALWERFDDSKGYWQALARFLKQF